MYVIHVSYVIIKNLIIYKKSTLATALVYLILNPITEKKNCYSVKILPTIIWFENKILIL